jgi:hypothetical protein
LDAVDGFVFGGLSLVAGCVILVRRGSAKNKRGESGEAEQSAATDDRQ